MIDFITTPNLPEFKVKTLICGNIDELFLKFFAQRKIEVLFTEKNISVDTAISCHADIVALHLGGRNIIIDKSQCLLKNSLLSLGMNVISSSGCVAGKYPQDISLNFYLNDDFIMGNIEFADKNLLDNISVSKIINVRQGYCKCSVLPIDRKSFITDDPSIYKACVNDGFDCLLVEKGDIQLEGHPYGFIGGAAGKISNNEVVFFGDAKKHRDYEKIKNFINSHDCKIISFPDVPLQDIGGIIPIRQTQAP